MKLIVISAPSGAGKTTLCQKLLAEIPSLRLSISCTTRAPRGKEQHGKEYFFLARDEFEKQIQADAFAEWANVHGNYYGTLKSTIEDSFRDGFSVLLDIDVQGAASLKKSFQDRCSTIFIAPPSLEELERRLRSRGTDSEETIQKRLKNAAGEMARMNEFEHRIVNDDLVKAEKTLCTLVKGLITK